jgi:hypothetical protein
MQNTLPLNKPVFRPISPPRHKDNFYKAKEMCSDNLKFNLSIQSKIHSRVYH